MPQSASAGDTSGKIKVEGLRRKKRRMKLKAKGGNGDHIIEKFTAQSSKSAKYAKTTVKKRDQVVQGGGMLGGDLKENKDGAETTPTVTQPNPNPT